MYSPELASYFERIGYSGPSVATLSTLQELHLLHPKAIVFENLDVLRKRPIRLDIESLWRKLIHRRRGGYCYEQNALFQAVLEAIGFSVSSLGARVLWRNLEGSVRPRSHMLLRIELPDAVYIADVGFGLLTLTAPLRLEAAIEQSTPHGTYRLVPVGTEMQVEARAGGGWSAAYQFSLQEVPRADWEVYNWYSSTHPDSRFTQELMVARPADKVLYGLLNGVLSAYHLDGHIERQIIGTPKDLEAVLRDQFGIDLPEDCNGILKSVLNNSKPPESERELLF